MLVSFFWYFLARGKLVALLQTAIAPVSSPDHFWRTNPPPPRACVRRMDQVVHMGHVGYDYPIAVQEQQNLSYGKGASPEGSASGATDTITPSVKDKAA